MFLTALLLGGAVLVVVQMRVALGLGEGEASPPPVTAHADPPPAVPPTPALIAERVDPAPAPDPVSSPTHTTRVATRTPVPPPSADPLLPDASSPADSAGDNVVDEVKACADGMAQARKLAEALPADDASRYFAERYLQQAATEVGNGETDECREFVGQAIDEVKEHRHTLAPGEKLHILRPDE